MRDFKLPPRCKWDLRYSAISRSVEWQFVTDVSGQTFGPIFKGQAVQEEREKAIPKRRKKLPF